MGNTGIIERLANQDLIHSMSLGEKMLASLYVTALGMIVTFVALLILWGCIVIMSKMLNIKAKPKKEVEVVEKIEPKPEPATSTAEEEDEELIAVITAAIAASLNTSTHNIIVRNIVRLPDTTPAWSRAGRVEQMNRML